MFLKLNKFFLLILTLILIIDFVKSDDLVNVRIKNGIINGKIQTFDGIDLNVFLGIPYAEPPIGDLRFKKPLPLKPWTHEINADHLPDSCYQLEPFPGLLGDSKQSEDCLYLNIWTPIGDNELEDQLKPVMFWIHGGALYMGSSVQEHFRGHVLAAKGDVVVVTINYRLNTLGFLYTGTDAAPGNMGLWDQSLALEWVNDNIRYFGGDPNRITIFGESAGGWSTSLHILSPVSRNLFQNAIVMSGAAINRIAGDEPENVLKLWLKGAEAIGCSDSENIEENTRFTQKIIDCLENTAPEVLASIPFTPEISNGLIGWMSSVVIDKQFLPKRPLEMLRSGDFKHNLNLLVGTVPDEGSWTLSAFIDPNKYNRFSPTNITYTEAYNTLSRVSEQMYSIQPIDGEVVSKLYFTGLSNQTNEDLLRRTIGVAIGDFLLACPVLQFAKELYKSDPKNSRVFQYHYNSKLGEPKLLCSDWMGVCHYDDIYPVFGVPFFGSGKYVDREREISVQMIKMFTDFAKTGKPTVSESVEWPEYYSLNGNIITPYYEITNEPKPVTNFGFGLKINECEYLWKRYIDRQ